MAISIHSNRFRAGLYHNMSAPPRTGVTLTGRAVTGGINVFSYTFALFVWEKSEKLLPGVVWRQRENHDLFSQAIRSNFSCPEELFEAVGKPVLPEWETDFLIGFRLNKEELHDPEKFGAGLCCDPHFCAGVLSRCVGNLCLSRRAPAFTWETLLALPIAFDDPFATLP